MFYWSHFLIYIIGILIAIFVYKNYSVRKGNSKNYFPPHLTKQRYLELSEIHNPSDPIDHKLLATALLKRAITDVGRIIQIRAEKAPLQNLVQSGAISHSVFDNLLKAEAELEVEVNLVMQEAEIYKKGWGNSIFNEASNLYNIQKQKQEQEELKSQKQVASKEQVLQKEELNIISEQDRLEIQNELIREEEALKKKKKK
jgi:translocation protein SEC66